jgi:aspartyl-tRNA(Asn)/glutamyl-tRNA(Gln) amidotransferase subunit B
MHEPGASYVDLNRAGVPLMELVTEADLRTAEDAWQYLTKLRTILRYLGVNTGNMEEGAMRCEVNISLRPVGQEAFGTKVEIKNLNSFRAVRLSIAYEIERQTQRLEAGEQVQQVTVGWDEDRGRTVFQRTKEGSEDYRYFPEPDLPPVELDEATRARLRARLPELPDAKLARFQAQYGIKAADAALLVADRAVADWAERAITAAQGGPSAAISPQVVANWLVGEVFRLLSESGAEISAIKLTPEALAELLRLLEQGTINGTVAKEVLAEMWASGEAAQAIVARRGLTQISDADALRQIVRDVLTANPGPVQQYLEGKEQVLGFIVGQVMKATRGKANVQVVRPILVDEIARLRP